MDEYPVTPYCRPQHQTIPSAVNAQDDESDIPSRPSVGIVFATFVGVADETGLAVIIIVGVAANVVDDDPLRSSEVTPSVTVWMDVCGFVSPMPS